MATVKVNGSNFEYIEKGIGKTVIFLHGGISDYRIWKEQIDPFAHAHRTDS
jgi:non-heme chloroperoxidase